MTFLVCVGVLVVLFAAVDYVSGLAVCLGAPVSCDSVGLWVDGLEFFGE
jgi:hypothetical protein